MQPCAGLPIFRFYLTRREGLVYLLDLAKRLFGHVDIITDPAVLRHVEDKERERGKSNTYTSGVGENPQRLGQLMLRYSLRTIDGFRSKGIPIYELGASR